MLDVEGLTSVISIMLLARVVEKVYSPPLLATLRLKRRMSSSSSSPRLFVTSHPHSMLWALESAPTMRGILFESQNSSSWRNFQSLTVRFMSKKTSPQLTVRPFIFKSNHANILVRKSLYQPRTKLTVAPNRSPRFPTFRRPGVT